MLVRTGTVPRSSSLPYTPLPIVLGHKPVNRCLTHLFKAVAVVRTRSYNPGVSNIRPRATIRPATRFYPTREVSQKCQNDRFVSIRCVFSSSKIRQNTFSAPDPAGRAYNAPPEILVGWGGGHPSPFPSPSTPSASLSGLRLV